MNIETQDALLWTARSFVYRFLLEHEVPPSAEKAAAGLGISLEEAKALYEQLHDRHLLFLEPEDRTAIRMAHPFSGVPTPFRVHANERSYWANCAWDAFGIPAALHADARMEAVCSDTGEEVTLGVSGDRVVGHGETVHIFLPFRRWYEDLIWT
jgi:hypothetical protein